MLILFVMKGEFLVLMLFEIIIYVINVSWRYVVIGGYIYLCWINIIYVELMFEYELFMWVKKRMNWSYVLMVFYKERKWNLCYLN